MSVYSLRGSIDGALEYARELLEDRDYETVSIIPKTDGSYEVHGQRRLPPTEYHRSLPKGAIGQYTYLR